MKTESDPDRLLVRPRLARAESTRARRLADQINDCHTQSVLSRLADEKEANALALEQQAFYVPPKSD